jgi:hypothetical protein
MPASAKEALHPVGKSAQGAQREDVEFHACRALGQGREGGKKEGDRLSRIFLTPH